eukprot:TRINITY_DN43430_c0_g1_i1.p1 TRINITY_DN43430_c0_g1~~TRINITY_DN43430_c0_g1_i1.p1  ORF type:complete len:1212 (+),score=429.02 TRINITY_DN43430_c0_g1_i1:62-3637(+)
MESPCPKTCPASGPPLSCAPSAVMNWLQEAPLLDPQIPVRVLALGGAVLGSASCVWACLKSAENRRLHLHRRTIHRRRVKAYIRDFEEQLEEARIAAKKRCLQDTHMVLPLRHEPSIIDAWPTCILPTLQAAATEAEEGGRRNASFGSSAQAKGVAKLIHIVNMEKHQNQKRLRVYPTLDEDATLCRAQQAVGISPDEPVNIVCLASGKQVRSLCYDALTEGAVYVLRVEHNPAKRRQSMVAKALSGEGELRYRKGVDFGTVLGLLRKSVLWGDTRDATDQETIRKLHQMLALNLLERMEEFRKNPDDVSYQLGTLDRIDQDLVSLLKHRNGLWSDLFHRRVLSRVLSCFHSIGLLRCWTAGYSRSTVLLKWRAPVDVVGAEQYAETGQVTSRELLEFMDQRLKKRRAESPFQLLKLMRLRYLQWGSIVRNASTWGLILISNFLRPFVSTLETRFNREVLDTATPRHIQRLGLTMLWLIGLQCCRRVCDSLTKYLTEKAVMETELSIQRTCLENLAMADQSFIASQGRQDGSGPLEALADTLSTDLVNVCTCLRRLCEWWSDVSALAGILYFFATSLGRDQGKAAFSGAVAGALTDFLWQSMKDGFENWVNPGCEEEDDKLELRDGTKVVYAPENPHHDIAVEVGEHGVVLEVVDGPLSLKCSFSQDRVVFLRESDVDHADGADSLLPNGGPEDITGQYVFSDMETFEVFRTWGLEVSQLQHGLDEEQRAREHQQRVSFQMVPLTVHSVLEYSKSKLSSALTTVVAVWVMWRLGVNWSRSVAPKAVSYKTQLDSALEIGWRLPKEMRSVTGDVFRGAARTLTLLEYEPTIDNGGGSAQEITSGEVVFEGVHFQYGQERRVLRGLDLRIGAGELVAFVGRSGCGKTSVFRLLSRLYDPTPEPLDADERPVAGEEYVSYCCRDKEWKAVRAVREAGDGAVVVASAASGEEWANPIPRAALGRAGTGGVITVGGQDIRGLQARHLRGAVVATMLQDVTLFDGTIAFNIKYGRPTATAAEVAEVCEAAVVNDFLNELPERLLARVGAGGVSLSGGQRRRIGLARALLACVCSRASPTQGRAKVLLLDEPTAGLDPSTETRVRQNLQEFAAHNGVTIVIISHSLPFIQECKLFLFGDPDIDADRGRIVAVGNYRDLYEQHALFRRFVDDSRVDVSSPRPDSDNGSDDDEGPASPYR